MYLIQLNLNLNLNKKRFVTKNTNKNHTFYRIQNDQIN